MLSHRNSLQIEGQKQVEIKRRKRYIQTLMKRRHEELYNFQIIYIGAKKIMWDRNIIYAYAPKNKAAKYEN